MRSASLTPSRKHRDPDHDGTPRPAIMPEFARQLARGAPRSPVQFLSSSSPVSEIRTSPGTRTSGNSGHERRCVNERGVLPRAQHRTPCSRRRSGIHRGQPSHLCAARLPRSSAALPAAERRLRHRRVRRCGDPARSRLGGTDAVASAGRLHCRTLLCPDFSREYLSIRDARRCFRPRLRFFPAEFACCFSRYSWCGHCGAQGLGRPSGTADHEVVAQPRATDEDQCRRGSQNAP